ncbi:MAG: hypothetical protein IJ927_05395, partial [Eubacterium sp.]|nr:hypothetical protein [Eubacterium sp.]
MDRFKISRKIMPMLLSLILVFSSFPVSVAYAVDDSKLASVSAFTAVSSATIDASDKSAITVQYNADTELDWVAKDDSIGRTKDGWWIGLKVVAPSLSGGYTVAELKNSKFKMTGLNGTAFTDYNFWDAQDSDKTDETEEIERYAGIWYFVNESVLNNAIAANKSLVSEMQFDWDNDDTYEQTINVSIDPEEVELYKEISSSREKVYPVSGGLGKVQAITEASSTTVDGSETNTVSVVNSSEIKLDWSQNDTSIGRTKDGWWYGVKITAPAGMGQTELEKSKLQLKAHGKDAWTDAMDFWGIRDSGASATVWAGLWLFVDQALVDAGNDIIHRARIDWDGDGVYEQLITTTLDPAKINLDYSNFNAMDAAKPAFSNVTDNGTVWVGDRDTYVISGNVVDQGTESKGTTYTSGMDKVEYAVGSETATRNTSTYNATNDSFEFTITDEFEGSYFIFAKDVQGNEEKKEITVKFDNKDPVLSDVAVDTSDWTKGKVVISGKVTDTLSGAQKVEYAYEKTSTQSGGTVYPATDGTFSIEIPAQEYEGNIVLTAYDVAQRTSTQSIAVKMDNVSFSSATATPDPSA